MGRQLGLFAAHEKDTGAFIGWFTVRPEPDDPPNEVELGYRLRQSAWGRGYATEGSPSPGEAGVHRAGVRLVWAETMTVNHTSRAVLDKVGMTLVGSIPTPLDMLMVERAERGGVRHEITEEQWIQRRKSFLQ